MSTWQAIAFCLWVVPMVFVAIGVIVSAPRSSKALRSRIWYTGCK